MTKKWELVIIERSGKVRYWGNREIAEMTHEQYLQTCYQAHSEAPASEIIYYALQDGWEPFAYNLSTIENSDTIAFRRVAEPEKIKPE